MGIPHRSSHLTLFSMTDLGSHLSLLTSDFSTTFSSTTTTHTVILSFVLELEIKRIFYRDLAIRQVKADR